VPLAIAGEDGVDDQSHLPEKRLAGIPIFGSPAADRAVTLEVTCLSAQRTADLFIRRFRGLAS
jgi:hypothetical protein